MSGESTSVTEAHFRYIAERTTPEDAFLRDLRSAALREGIPPIQIAPEQAAFLQILLRAAGARYVVEVGTLAGYSAIAMARALPPEGRVTTIEIHPGHAAFAERWIARSDVASKVEVRRGAGIEILRTLPSGSADAAFLDADKTSYPLYLEECLRIVRKGGVLLADNAFAFGQLLDPHPTDREAPAMKAFNEVIARDRRLQSVIVPLGDGCWVGVKVAG
jgi:caffeoyl-CoA O-methyltransferase